MSRAGAGQLSQVGGAPARARTRVAAAPLACFALGAALGTLLDGIHAYGDVLAYPDPDFGRWAWFVPLEFGLVGLAAGLVVPALERALAPGAAPRWPVARRVAETLLFAGLYTSTALVGQGGAAALALALGALALVRVLAFGAPGDWAYALAAAVLGPAAEAVISALGAFEYLEPDIAGIPFWLPALWANGGLLIRRLIRPIVMRDAQYGDERGGRSPDRATGRAADSAPGPGSA